MCNQSLQCTYSKLLSVIKTLEANETQRENEYFLNKFVIQLLHGLLLAYLFFGKVRDEIQ